MFRKLDVMRPIGNIIEPLSGPYINSNEQKQEETLEILHKHPNRDKPGIHVGFSVWFNFDIICTTRPQVAAIFDIDPDVNRFIYPIFSSLIIKATSRDEFISLFLEEIAKGKTTAPFHPYLQSIFSEQVKNTHGFLAKEENFRWLKTMFKEKKIFLGSLDITNSKNMLLLHEWIIENNLVVKTLYLSNIPEWLSSSSSTQWNSAKKNILRLIQKETLLIDAFYPTTTKYGSGPPLRITEGELPNYQLIRESKKRTRQNMFLFTKTAIGRLDNNSVDGKQANSPYEDILYPATP